MCLNLGIIPRFKNSSISSITNMNLQLKKHIHVFLKFIENNQDLYCFILYKKKNRDVLLRDMYLEIYGNSYRCCDNV